MASFFSSFHRPKFDIQPAFEAAVVIPTILRPSLCEALKSIFAQDLCGRIHVLVGVDFPGGNAKPDLSLIENACRDIPENCLVQVLYPGFSTSVRHGGLSEARDGGTLRTVLSHLANSDYVAYLDDDNSWAPEHLRSLRRALVDMDYAFSLRWFVHPQTGQKIAVDEWESVGPGAGVFNERFGGFVDPNTLMVDRRRCREAIVAWTIPLPGDVKAMSADRMVFARLLKHLGAGSGLPTSFYRIDPMDSMHPRRLEWLGSSYAQS